MTVSEVLGGLGSWELQLAESTPDEIRRQVGFFGHLAVVDGTVDVAQTGDALLDAARYVGVLRQGAATLNPGGAGMVYWLGDEDDKGPVLEGATDYTNLTLAQIVTDLVARVNAVAPGTVHPQADPGQRYTGAHQYQTVRKVLDSVTAVFGAEYRVNGDATLDVGTAEQLYGDTPRAVIKRRGAGTDLDLIGVGGDFDPSNDVLDFSTRVVLLGQTQDDRTIATGSADAPSLPYFNLHGNPVRVTRLISESGETAGSVEQRAQLQINRFFRAKRAVTIDLADYETDTRARVGEHVWVYDPDTGLVDPANEVFFRGEVLHPVLERVSGATWNVREGMTVAFRTHTGMWLDLTPFVTWETGSDELTVGDQASTLTRPGSEIQDRLDATRGPDGGPLNAVAPKAPTGLVLTTSSTLDSAGRDAPVITATWVAPTQNTDDTALTDLAFYSVQYHWTGRPERWETAGATALTTIDLNVAPGLPYEVRVQAVDSDGQRSAWSTVEAITSAADSTAPPTPSDPIVGNYLGQLRIEWDGLTSTGGAMPGDLNRVEVHVGTSSGFTPSAATLVSSLSTKGVAYATAPYGATRFVRLIAYDHQGNPSGASGTVTGSTSQVVATDIGGNVIDLSHVTFKDQGNLVPDGSFRIATLTAERAAQSGWTAVTGADGSAGMQWSPGDGNLTLATGVPVEPGEQIVTRYWFQSSADATTAGRIWIRALWSLSTGGTLSQQVSGGGHPNVPDWFRTTPVYITVPDNAVTAEFFATVEGATAGTWTLDQVEVRKVIGTMLIRDAAITTAKINDLAVNNAKIADLSVGKLTAGTMTADVTMSGRFATALTGARREMNALGFQAWDASNNLIISLTGANNLLTGTLQTALTGRRIVAGAAGAVGDLSFYAPDGKRGFVRSYTESTGTEAIQFGIEVAGYTDNLWNRINYNSSSQGEYAIYRSGTHEFVYDSTAPNEEGRFVVFQTSDRGNDPSDVRLQIDAGGTLNYYPIAGHWRVYDRSDFSGVSRLRLWIRDPSVTLYHFSGGDTTISERVGSTAYGRFQVGDVENWMMWPNTSQALIVRRNDDWNSTQNGSPFLKLNNGHGYGATLEWRSTNTGTFAGLHVKWQDNATYAPITASAFNPSSSQRVKRDIRDAGPVRDLIAGLVARRYKRRDDPDARESLGFVAEEVPAVFQVLGEDGLPAAVDTYGMLTALVAEVQDLRATVARLEGAAA